MAAPARNVLLVGSKLDEPNLLRKAVEAGTVPLLVQKHDELQPTHLAQAPAILVCDYEDTDRLVELARGLHAALRFDAVVSLREIALVPAAIVNDALGLPGTSRLTATTLRNKWLMRERLAEVGLSPVRAAVTAAAPAALAGAVASVGCPVVVKPIGAGGSYCIFRVDEAAQVARVAAELARNGVDEVIVEEFLDGPEISVESFSFAGRHVVVAITDKLTDEHHIEIGHSMPSRIADAERAAVVALVERFLDAVGLHDGPAHTELKLTARGPRVIESHNRIGGDFINLLVHAAYGIDMVALTFAWVAGTAQPLRASPAPVAAAAIRFSIADPGTVVAIDGVDAVRALPDVLDAACYRTIGERVPAAQNNMERSGHVAVRAATAAAAAERCAELARTIAIRTAPVGERDAAAVVGR